MKCHLYLRMGRTDRHVDVEIREEKLATVWGPASLLDQWEGFNGRV